MTDAYADLPPKKRRHSHDPLRPVIPAAALVKYTVLVAVPGLAVGVYQVFQGKHFITLLAVAILLVLVSYCIAVSFLKGFTETLQRGIHLQRREPIKYWIGMTFLLGLYIFVCAIFIGI